MRSGGYAAILPLLAGALAIVPPVSVTGSGRIEEARLLFLDPDRDWLRSCVGDLLATLTVPPAREQDRRELIYELTVRCPGIARRPRAMTPRFADVDPRRAIRYGGPA